MRIELGCGETKRDPGAVGVDVLDLPGVDVVSDALGYLQTLPADSVDSIYSEHFLEHLLDPHSVVAEACRVLRVGGTFRAVVPHFSNPYYYSDPTHRTPFGLYTFSYWCAENDLRRQVPHYAQPLPLRLDLVRYAFKAGRTFPVRHAVVAALGSLVNLGRWSREFWEQHLCWLLPAYEIRYELTRLPDRPAR